MAKSQNLEILESTSYGQRNDRSFCGPGQLSTSLHHAQLVSPQNVFLTSSDDSSFTFILSDMPKSNTNSTGGQNKPHLMQSYGSHSMGRHSLATEASQPYYTTSDPTSRSVPKKYHSKVHLEFDPSPGYGVVNHLLTIESRKPNSNKLKGNNPHQNLIEFGSPPHSPLKSPTDTHQTYHYAVPGKYEWISTDFLTRY